MRRVNRHSVVACLTGAVLGLLGVSTAGAQTCYRLTDIRALGFPPGTDDMFGINNLGETAFTAVVNGEKHAFVWLPNPNYGLVGGLHDLNLLPEPDLSGPSAAHDINMAGFVSGSVTVNGEQHAFVWKLGDPAVTFDLTTFPSPANIDLSTVAWAINDDTPPVAVGVADGTWECHCQFDGPTTLGFRVPVQAGQSLVALEPLNNGECDGQSLGRDINTPSAGAPQIVGFSDSPEIGICNTGEECETERDAVRWLVPTSPTVLPDLGPAGSAGRGNNNARQVAGWGFASAIAPCQIQALFWEVPVIGFFNLGAIPELVGFQTRAEAINNPDQLGRIQVVGWNETEQVALLWERATPISTWSVTDLNDVIAPCSQDFVVVRGDDVNDSGWIIAVADDPDTPGVQAHAVLLTPLAQCPPDTCDADLNGDGTVGILDLLTLLTAWGPCPDLPESCFADLNCDGSVGILDLLELLASWGPCGTGGGEVPRTVEDCLNKFCCEEENILAIEKCLCAIQFSNCN